MVKHIFECWITPDAADITFTTKENAQELTKQGLIPQQAFLQYSIEADTVEEACSIHNLRQGWGAYKPMGEAKPCPKCDSWFYPEGSGECWKCGKINLLHKYDKPQLSLGKKGKKKGKKTNFDF